MNHYRLFREHKYLVAVFNQVLKVVSLANFKDPKSLIKIKKNLKKLKLLLESHAEYEETRIHKLLEIKASFVHQQAECEHKHHTEFFTIIENKLKLIENESNAYKVDMWGHEYIWISDCFSLKP